MVCPRCFLATHSDAARYCWQCGEPLGTRSLPPLAEFAAPSRSHRERLVIISDDGDGWRRRGRRTPSGGYRLLRALVTLTAWVTGSSVRAS